MFLEVYIIPTQQYSISDIDSHMIEKNKRTISLNQISSIGPDNKDRAEIIMYDDSKYHTVGSYCDIIDRLSRIDTVSRLPDTA